MDAEGSSAGKAWHDRPQVMRAIVIVALVALAVEGVFAIGFKENDFNGHVLQGQELRDVGLGCITWEWYPLGRHVWNASLSFAGTTGSRVICYALAVAAIFSLFRMWCDLARIRRDSAPGLDLIAFALAGFCSFTFVRRELDECGLHLLLLWMLTAAAWSISRNKPAWAGLWLACAITFKSTPLLFLPVLVWKRQWKAASWATALVLIANLLPAAWLGWHPTLEYHSRFFDRAVEFASQRDPSAHVVEPPKYLNQNLKTALARFVQTYPPGHPLHLEHPAFVQFGNLGLDSARRAVMVGMLVILALIGWPMRRTRWGTDEKSGDLATEWAALGVVAAILSPFCWKQHLVAVWPVMFLVMREQLLADRAMAAGAAMPAGYRFRQVGVWAYAGLVLLSARGLLGAELAEVALSYKVYTWAALVALALGLTLRRTNVASAAQTSGERAPYARAA